MGRAEVEHSWRIIGRKPHALRSKIGPPVGMGGCEGREIVSGMQRFPKTHDNRSDARVDRSHKPIQQEIAMNLSLATNVAGIAKSLMSALSPAASVAVTPAAARTPAATTQLSSPDVLRGAGKPNAAMQWTDSVAERGSITVSGKGGEKPTPPGGENGIIFVGGRPAEKANSLAERGIIIVGGKPMEKSNSLAERGIIFVGGMSGNHRPVTTESVKEKLSRSLGRMEGDDKLGNFQIQDLMSTYNQNETLASSVMKKRDDTSSNVIGKI